MFSYLLYRYKFQYNVAVCWDEIMYKQLNQSSYFDKEMSISLLYSICKEI